MNWAYYFVGALVATSLFAAISVAARGLHLTRMDFPLILGTMFTAKRHKAVWIGGILQFINGACYSALYYIILSLFEGHYVFWGMALGLLHAFFILTVVMSILPAIHPRMATDLDGPAPTPMLESPGFFSLHYGSRTPLVIFLEHLVFGAVLGFVFARIQSADAMIGF